MPQNPKQNTDKSKQVALGDIIRSFYMFIEEQYSRKEKSVLTALTAYNHKDHMVFNMTKTGTFTDKISALRDLTKVS